MGFRAPLSGDVTQAIKTSLVRSAEQRAERLVAGVRAPRRDPEANGDALRLRRSAYHRGGREACGREVLGLAEGGG